mmetsp:Transcript_29724/g.59069  ORF Transcript_29724/g.59069 Transcript_29724/m.59069 type:complete len:201 (-) Transcript_29724:2517-3119(-)
MANGSALELVGVEIHHLADHVIAPARIARLVQGTQRTFRHDRLHACIRCHLGIIPNILRCILDRKGKLVRVAINAVPFDKVHHPGLQRPSGNHVVNALPFNAHHVRHGKHLAHSVGHSHAKEVIEQLDRVPRTERAKVKNILAKVFQHGTDGGECRLIARTHDIQQTIHCMGRCPAQRRIQIMPAGGSHCLAQSPGGAGQ